MGTDRIEAYRGKFVCGGGEVVINFCTPDHPWPTQSKWFETSVSCRDCLDNYSLIEQGKHFVFVKKSDLKVRDEYWSEYLRRGEELLAWPEVIEILEELEGVLENQSSMAACHRLLSAHRLEYYSVGTFRKKWSGASDWIRNNVRVSNLENVMNLIGKREKKVEDELKVLEALYEKYKEPLPIVGEPLLDASRYRQ